MSQQLSRADKIILSRRVVVRKVLPNAEVYSKIKKAMSDPSVTEVMVAKKKALSLVQIR